MDFIVRLRLKLAIITNGSNSMNLNKMKKIIKNVKSTSLINKNMIVAISTLIIIEIKKLKIQILKLKV